MSRERFKEEVFYSTSHTCLSDSNYHDIQSAIQNNHAVGFAAGHYDSALSIAYVSEFFLHNLGYGYPEFMQATGGSLRRVLYGQDLSYTDPERLSEIEGEGEVQLLNADGVPIHVHAYKTDTIDPNGQKLWLFSAHIDQTLENLNLINRVISSGFWSINFDKSGEPCEALFSHEFRTMLGYGDIVDFPNRLDSWQNALHPADRSRVENALRAAYSDKTGCTKFDADYRMRLADGSYQWFHDSAETTRRADGLPYRMAGIFVNIDREKRLMQRTRRVDAFHRAYTASNLCEYYLDLQTGHTESLKPEPRLPDLDALSSWDALVECYAQRYVLPEYRADVLSFFNREHLMQKFRESKSELELDCRILVNGEELWVRNTAFLDTDSEGSGQVMILVRDVSGVHQQLAEQQELTRQNRIKDLLIQSTSRLVDRYAACDLENDTYHFYSQDISDSAYAPSGFYHDLVQAMAARFKMFSGPLTLQEAFSLENIRKNLHSPKDIYRFEYCSLDETQFKSLAISPLAWNGSEVSAVLLMSQDTTAEKRVEMEARRALKDAYETAERASRAKTEFLSNMSHDIRTPMNAIIGMTAIAGANMENPDRVVDCLGKITQSSRHLLSLINEVLDMSRIESGKITLAEEEFNLSDLCENLVSIAKTDADLHHHDFEVHINHIEHEDVCGDSIRIQQLITNILANANKYTPDGGRVDFTIRELPSRSSGSGCYQFIVQDNGIGMSEEFQKVLFEPFTRADDKRTSKVQGTGLGMAIARNFARMMNGEIQVKSAPGKGSTFTVTIFLKLQHKISAPIEELIDLPVLVVDDDPACCETTVSLLNEIGIRGEFVTSGQEAVQRTMEHYRDHNNYFAVILDWKMPGMDGVETARRIRREVGRDITIIILSAYDYSAIEQEARAAGVDEFIAKPLFRSRLTAAFKNIIEGKPRQNAQHYLSDLAACRYTGKRILLVEDNNLNREIAEEIIGMTGAEVIPVENGREAVDKIADSPEHYFDLVFMDVQMPVMNGYEATAAIRSLPSDYARNIPIIAMTANAFAEDVLLAKNAGMNEHIPKPLDLARLQEALQRWL